MNNTYIQIIILVVFIAIMYFLLIRPQKKKEQEINKMRSSIAVGDQIVTIGGICGKVIKTKDDTLIIQVGADKTKMEMKRWAVSTIEKKSDKAPEKFEDEEVRKTKPKRLGKKELNNWWSWQNSYLLCKNLSRSITIYKFEFQ